MESNPPDSEQPEQPESGVQQATADELSEDQALALLKRSDLTAEAIALLGRNPNAIKSRKVAFALAIHHRTPRHIAIPTLRRLFIFDLMQVALTPAVAGDIKRAAEDQILHRLESLTVGERISLARRASRRVAAALLLDADIRVISTALANSHLVEAAVVTALMKNDALQTLFQQVSEHSRWSQRREVQIALLRSGKTPLESAIALARNFSTDLLCKILPQSRLSMILKFNDSAVTGDSE
jgi:hypothetical protein